MSAGSGTYVEGGKLIPPIPDIVQIIKNFDPYYVSKALTREERREIMILEAKKARLAREGNK